MPSSESAMAGDQPQRFAVDKQASPCWFCGSTASCFFEPPDNEYLRFSCATSGTFLVNSSLRSAYTWTVDQKAMLSAHCRRNRGDRVLIGPDRIERLCTLVPTFQSSGKNRSAASDSRRGNAVAWELSQFQYQERLSPDRRERFAVGAIPPRAIDVQRICNQDADCTG